ncbi:hypothetical protein K438DRAFT_1822419 [Mycena galopus ATCC 62051]|nr:hypothetical protein K438DRAFT_1822419 [Mycena galopus ATCC 62051]
MSLRPFRFTHPSLPNGPPFAKRRLTNPLELLLCRYPLGPNIQNPNFTLIHSRLNPFDEYQDPLWTTLTSSSPAPLTPSSDAAKKKFWMKTYSENEGMLEQLEEQNILRRTGETHKQGYVTLIAVETVIKVGEWAECCAACGKREQLDSEGPRMLRCSGCQESWYCNKACQTEAWSYHKADCKRFKKMRTA